MTGIRRPNILVPAWLLKGISLIMYQIGKTIGMPLMGIHPDRINKLMISTNIIGEKLNNDYPLEFSLEQAITDWYNDCQQEGLF